MRAVYGTKLPAGVTIEAVVKDLTDLSGGLAKIEVRSLSRSGQGGKLGAIDPSSFEIIVQLLDTEAAAAAVQAIFAGVSGYLLGKTGKKPSVEKSTTPDKDEA